MALTINSNTQWDYSIRGASKTKMTAYFTDETVVDDGEDAPTNWLWDFGDGHFSTEQHPTHVYRGRFYQDTQDFTNAVHNVEYTVTLTAWSGGSFKNDIFYQPVITDTYRGVDNNGYGSHAAAQSALILRLPQETWTYLNKSAVQYDISEPTSFGYTALYNEKAIDLSAHSVDTFVGYAHFSINTFKWETPYYANGFPYACRFGVWNKGANTWMNHPSPPSDGHRPLDYDVQHIAWLEESPIVDYVCLDFSKWAGTQGITYLRGMDGYEWNLPTQVSRYVGYLLFTDCLQTAIWIGITPKNKGVSSKSLTGGEIIISRPAQLHSGIREAYFNDGWEDEKHFYLEVSGAYPCTIQYFDLYVNTTNE